MGEYKQAMIRYEDALRRNFARMSKDELIEALVELESSAAKSIFDTVVELDITTYELNKLTDSYHQLQVSFCTPTLYIFTRSAELNRDDVWHGQYDDKDRFRCLLVPLGETLFCGKSLHKHSWCVMCSDGSNYSGT